MADNEQAITLRIEASDSVSVHQAEAWAVGQRGGEDVPDTDPTYHNNAKYYSEQTGQDVSDAEAWGNGTRGGEPLEPTDPIYQRNGAYHSAQAQAQAQNAAASANAASGSAGAAAESAETAAQKAQEAIDTVVAAQGPGIVYMSDAGEFFVLQEG